MEAIDKHGRQVSVDGPKGPVRQAIGHLAGWSDDEIRGFLTRLLLADGLPRKRIIRVLRTSRTSHYRDATTPRPQAMTDDQGDDA